MVTTDNPHNGQSRPHGSSYPDGENLTDPDDGADATTETPSGWTPPIRIVHTPQPLPDLPIPPTLRPYVNAIEELAGCSRGTAHCAVMGSINLAIADAIDVESLAADTHPSSLFLLTSAKTGWRKSAAFGLAFKAHRAADNAIDARWEAARRAKKASKDNKDSGDSPSSSAEPVSFFVLDLVDSEPADAPRRVSPISLRDDSTIEALMMNLSQGRRSQSLASPEAGTMLGGWSFGRGQIAQTLAKLSALWSGEAVNFERATGRLSFRIADVRLSACLMAQPIFVVDHLLSEAASNGFAARTLLNRDISRPEPMAFEGAGTPARYYVDRLNVVIATIRQGQDVGAEYRRHRTQHPNSDAPDAGGQDSSARISV